jgi:hypothetical protein
MSNSQVISYWFDDNDRHLSDGTPLSDEYYGPCWVIRSSAGRLDPAVIVPDPGDGSARKLAERILAALCDS